MIRPPMTYGKESKGNHVKLAQLAKEIPFFPSYQNKRSMVHIDNLCEFLALIILHVESGTFHPQNSEYVCTSELVSTIGNVHNHRVREISIFNPFIKPLVHRQMTINKLFRDFAYVKELSDYPYHYQVHEKKYRIDGTVNLNDRRDI